jgi:hypothetical protein
MEAGAILAGARKGAREMTTERLRGMFDDGIEVVVLKITAPIPGYPHLSASPIFTLKTGETLTQRAGDTDQSRFVAVQTGRNVTIIR